jgi:beta-galactosidase
VNGYIVKRNQSGYAPFRVGTTISSITTQYRDRERRRDACEGWFYEGAGIYRHVELVALTIAYPAMGNCGALRRSP